jgi:uncharacterized repeat protein (TIGR03803 family)
VNFDYSNGARPYLASLVQGVDGNIYGTTSVGGANGPYGTVFKITPKGALTTLHSFAGYDGAFPSAGLVQATNGYFYGTTEVGGAGNYSGTLFRMAPGGAVRTLYSFCAETNCTDGGQPDGALIQGSDGDLYSTTQTGGANGYGTVFKVTLDGKLTTLYSFCAQNNCRDGAFPNAGLVQATDGNFYGTTFSTIFRITPQRKLTTLHNFTGADGENIISPLIQASDGNFYGTASAGGQNGANCGTVFKITRQGVLTTLYSFSFNGEGIIPEGPLVQATDGNFYGTTYLGGAYGNGTVFKITTAGMLTTLYSFCAESNCPDGDEPFGGLIQDTNGKLYGTTWYGGTDDEGTLFSLGVGLRAFVETQPKSGKVGAAVNILGTNLQGATSVTFNRTLATFRVVSNSQITTVVPTAATTGEIRVVTPGGTLRSNGVFRVIP